MTRRFEGNRLVVATHNEGKWREFAQLLDPYAKNIISSGDLGLPEPAETGATFAENAILKAKAAALKSGFPALADDSGLCVAALDGQPGIYSARWAGAEKNFHAAMERVHTALGDNPDRAAHFTCVLALAWSDGHVETVEGRVEGHIVWPPRGDQGFGYDPIFQPLGHDRTFGEMTDDEKHAISHRAIAAHKLVMLYFTRH